MTAATPGLIVERLDSILILTINRAHCRNAIDTLTSAAIDEQMSLAESDPAIGAVILTGAGDIAFCAGMDMKEAARIGPGHGLIPGRGFAGITERQRTKPLIAAVNGIAVAGGLELALAADIIIAADHACFGLSEVKRGLFAFAGGIQRLARQIPRSMAMSMILTGDPVPAARMWQLGLVSDVVPGDRLRDHVIDYAQTILGHSWDAIANGKALYDMAVDMPISQGLLVGNAFGMATLSSAGSREGIAAFAEKRTVPYPRDRD